MIVDLLQYFFILAKTFDSILKVIKSCPVIYRTIHQTLDNLKLSEFLKNKDVYLKHLGFHSGVKLEMKIILKGGRREQTLTKMPTEQR